jgi:two-component system heavy metal sensor histidine kinase CusS
MMRTRSIGFQLTAWYAAILTAGLGLFGGLIWLSMRARLNAEVDADLKGRASRFEAYFKEESLTARDRHLRNELEEFSQAFPPGSSIDLHGPEGLVFHYGAQEPGARVLHSRFTADGQAFDLVLSTSLDTVMHTLQLLRLLLWSLFPIMIVVACMGGAWLSRRALKPVKDITDAALVLSVENLSGRLPVPPTGDELARLTEVLNSTLARLEDAMNTLSQFVADASHEIRTPLAVIRTTAELALRRARTPESYRESLQDVAVEAARMTQLVEDLLMLARGDSGAWQIPLEPVNLGQLLQEVGSEMRRVAELREIRIEIAREEKPAIVAGSRPALHRLFVVLVDNAVKYSPPGARVLVGLDLAQDRAVVSVRDFGSGISPQDIPHIFKRFYRADKVRGGDGYGLGLALAQSIARAHGTSIEVESKEGEGSLFRVAFVARQTKLELPTPTKDAAFS